MGCGSGSKAIGNMASILVVEDVEDYCQEIASGLRREGHDVRCATNGREAVSVGCTFRPEVLVTDWLLNEQLNGLDVSEVLRLVHPDMRTILISGFGSSDLKRDVERYDVFEFLEKPFHLAQVKDSVNRAVQPRAHSQQKNAVAIIELEGDAEIVYRNQKAQELFAGILPGVEVSSISQIIPENVERVLESAAHQWVGITLAVGTTETWFVRLRKLPETGRCLVVLLDQKSVVYKSNFSVLQLLDVSDPEVKIHGHLLIIDDMESVRTVTRDLLRRFSKNLHTASDQREALRLFVRDNEIRVVILDYDLPGGSPKELIDFMRQIRPETVFIGTSALNHAADFARLGVDLFVQKPWSVGELLNVMGVLN